MLYMPKRFPVSYAYDAINNGRDSLSMDKLLSYVKRMSSSILNKRLGYMLEKCGIDVYDELKGSISKNNERLRYSMGERIVNARWHAMTW